MKCRARILHWNHETVSLFPGLALSICLHQRQNKIQPGGTWVNQKEVCFPDSFVVPSHCWRTSDFPDSQICAQFVRWVFGVCVLVLVCFSFYCQKRWPSFHNYVLMITVLLKTLSYIQAFLRFLSDIKLSLEFNTLLVMPIKRTKLRF